MDRAAQGLVEAAPRLAPVGAADVAAPLVFQEPSRLPGAIRRRKDVGSVPEEDEDAVHGTSTEGVL